MSNNFLLPISLVFEGDADGSAARRNPQLLLDLVKHAQLDARIVKEPAQVSAARPVVVVLDLSVGDHVKTVKPIVGIVGAGLVKCVCSAAAGNAAIAALPDKIAGASVVKLRTVGGDGASRIIDADVEELRRLKPSLCSALPDDHPHRRAYAAPVDFAKESARFARTHSGPTNSGPTSPETSFKQLGSSRSLLGSARAPIQYDATHGVSSPREFVDDDAARSMPPPPSGSAPSSTYLRMMERRKNRRERRSGSNSMNVSTLHSPHPVRAIDVDDRNTTTSEAAMSSALPPPYVQRSATLPAAQDSLSESATTKSTDGNAGASRVEVTWKDQEAPASSGLRTDDPSRLEDPSVSGSSKLDADGLGADVRPSTPPQMQHEGDVQPPADTSPVAPDPRVLGAAPRDATNVPTEPESAEHTDTTAEPNASAAQAPVPSTSLPTTSADADPAPSQSESCAGNHQASGARNVSNSSEQQSSEAQQTVAHDGSLEFAVADQQSAPQQQPGATRAAESDAPRGATPPRRADSCEALGPAVIADDGDDDVSRPAPMEVSQSVVSDQPLPGDPARTTAPPTPGLRATDAASSPMGRVKQTPPVEVSPSGVYAAPVGDGQGPSVFDTTTDDSGAAPSGVPAQPKGCMNACTVM